MNASPTRDLLIGVSVGSVLCGLLLGFSLGRLDALETQLQKHIGDEVRHCHQASYSHDATDGQKPETDIRAQSLVRHALDDMRREFRRHATRYSLRGRKEGYPVVASATVKANVIPNAEDPKHDGGDPQDQPADRILHYVGHIGTCYQEGEAKHELFNGHKYKTPSDTRKSIAMVGGIA